MTSAIRPASARRPLACALESFLPAWACTSCSNAARVLHAAPAWPASSFEAIASTFEARLRPGPTPVTAAKSSSSWLGAPLTVTVKLRVLAFPAASVAVQLTVVTPTGNSEPDVGEQTRTGCGSTRSLAEATQTATAPAGPVAFRTIGVGTATSGAVVSTTFTSKDVVDVFPARSVAVQRTVVVPSGKT